MTDSTPNDEAIAVLQRALQQRERDEVVLSAALGDDMRARTRIAGELSRAESKLRRTQSCMVQNARALNSLKKAITDLGG